MPTVSIDDYRALVGKPLGSSGWLTVSQEMIDRFADATGDHQFIHVDPERAAATPFGGTIAHGFLSLSLMSGLYETADLPRPAGMRMGVNYGGDKTRFLTSVRAGKRVRAHFQLLAFEEKQPGRHQQTIEYVLEIEGEEKPALVSEWIMLIFT